MYRVDNKDFDVGQTIAFTAPSYFKNLTKEGQNIEQILLKHPSNTKQIKRKTALFIFRELRDAIRFCINVSDSKIYKVKALSNTIKYHKGDMCWTELMFAFSENKNLQEDFAKRYWCEESTHNPCCEFLVDKVEVTQVFFPAIITRDAFKQQYLDAETQIEKMKFYKNNL